MCALKVQQNRRLTITPRLFVFGELAHDSWFNGTRGIVQRHEQPGEAVNAQIEECAAGEGHVDHSMRGAEFLLDVVPEAEICPDTFDCAEFAGADGGCDLDMVC